MSGNLELCCFERRRTSTPSRLVQSPKPSHKFHAPATAFQEPKAWAQPRTLVQVRVSLSRTLASLQTQAVNTVIAFLVLLRPCFAMSPQTRQFAGPDGFCCLVSEALIFAKLSSAHGDVHVVEYFLSSLACRLHSDLRILHTLVPWPTDGMNPPKIYAKHLQEVYCSAYRMSTLAHGKWSSRSAYKNASPTSATLHSRQLYTHACLIR